MLSNGLNDEEKYVRRGKNKKHEKFWLGNLMKEEQSLELCVDLRNVKKRNLPPCYKDVKYVILESNLLAFMINVQVRKAVNFFDHL